MLLYNGPASLPLTRCDKGVGISLDVHQNTLYDRELLHPELYALELQRIANVIPLLPFEFDSLIGNKILLNLVTRGDSLSSLSLYPKDYTSRK